MEIRVRELLAFIKANPRLEEYDAPLHVNTPSEEHFDVEVNLLELGQVKGRLVLSIGVETDAHLCDNCKDGELQELQDKIERLEEKIHELETAKTVDAAAKV